MCHLSNKCKQMTNAHNNSARLFISEHMRAYVLVLLCLISSIAKSQGIVKASVNNSYINAVYTYGFVNRVYILASECECRELEIKSNDFVITTDSTVNCLFELVAKHNRIRQHSLDVYCKKSLIGNFDVVAINPPTPFVQVYGHDSNFHSNITVYFDSIEVKNSQEFYNRRELNYQVLEYDINFYDSTGLVRTTRGYGKYIPKEDAIFFKTNIQRNGFYVEVSNIKIQLEYQGEKIYYYTDFEIMRPYWYNHR